MEHNSEISNGKVDMDDDATMSIEFDKAHEVEICRIISQYLQEKGLNESAKVLQKESGVYLEGAIIQKFRTMVLEGNFDEVVKLIYEIEYDSESICKVKQAIFEQKYLELLENNEKAKALDCLRNELLVATKECADYEEYRQIEDGSKDRIKILSSLIMCKNGEEINKIYPWDGSKGESRKRLLEVLQSYISPQKMLENGRLESLLKQSLHFQIATCKFHDYDKKDHNYSLLEKHK